jgi:hypothetical protein
MLLSGLSTDNSLYFPVINASEENGYGYYLSSPSSRGSWCYTHVLYSGRVGADHDGKESSVRPLVCLKANITATQDEDGVWQLRTIEE